MSWHKLVDTDKSFSTVKAKMKLADSIYPLLGLPERDEMMKCAELNAKTMEYALSIASETALERMTTKGRSLTFGDDIVYVWGGIAWEYSGGIQWTLSDDDSSVELKSPRYQYDKYTTQDCKSQSFSG